MIDIRTCKESDLDAIVILGNRYKRYLGLLPPEAISNAIAAGHVIGAFEATSLIGYTLFDLPYADIRLVHLCIAPEGRRRGVARRLIDEIAIRHSDRQGIRLKCRHDYEANEAWPRLGFCAQSQGVGRGKDRAEMTVWWRDFGQTDLFASALEDDDRIKAVLDTNVVLDMILERGLTNQYFDSPAVVGEVSYCLAPSVKNELAKTPDAAERTQVMKSFGKFDAIAVDLATVDHLSGELFDSIAESERKRDPSLEADARVLAEAIVTGADVLLTNDENASRLMGPLALANSVDILHPSQLTAKIDELKGRRRNSGDRIQNTVIEISDAPAGSDRGLDHLIATRSGETKSAFRRLLRQQSACGIRVIHVSNGKLAEAILSTRVTDEALVVDIIRVRRSTLGPTLLKQILFQLRQEAMAKGTARIVFRDPHPGGGEEADEILASEGARQLDGYWTIAVVNLQVSESELTSGVVGALDLRPWGAQNAVDPDEYDLLERELWPLKITDAPIFCYVVPTKQLYASELLGYDSPLLNRKYDLGVSRRHVYYKSPGNMPKNPARILWYASGKNGGYIVASSRLISTMKAKPETLHSKFQRYGVWSLADIAASAGKSDRAGAIQFGDTEVFRQRVKLSEAQSIVARHGKTLSSVPTLREIPREAYEEIYWTGMKK
ncbi:GNAT family N-acetyltransferase [Paenarthrobacter sp. PH39-S1]|uniref:GNAT family N-acetyltransferase n=1 Tax=Paenarthrobacter sp. PH39-S1 TaxID=3046204 RepID=UPI0024BB8B1E|nr:GNAT family N-acetyltransferase [Paenarthrobacter sp. PH39-S1]MDJ0356324.1 GNAT family N-acetyltransferase [Paenarthrobacter sp. PH39-S1]